MLRTFAIALSMSADAFAASVGQGAALNRPKIVEALRMARVFGTVEMLTPVAGWLCGRAAGSVVAEIDHWIAFGLLGALGAKMIWEGTMRPAHPGQQAHPRRLLPPPARTGSPAATAPAKPGGSPASHELGTRGSSSCRPVGLLPRSAATREEDPVVPTGLPLALARERGWG